MANEIELAKRVVARLESGSITMAELLEALSPEPEKVAVPEKLPLPAVITQSQHDSLARLSEVYGSVVPKERREIEPEEAGKLIDEKQVLDDIKKMVEARHQSIRTTIFNHLDVEAERLGLVNDDTPRDKDGHYVLDGEIRPDPTETNKVFKRETRTLKPALDPSALQALVDDPDVEFSHQDYLSMTTQTRVVDENKIMLALKKNPKLIHAISKATRPGSKSASLNLRNG